MEKVFARAIKHHIYKLRRLRREIEVMLMLRRVIVKMDVLNMEDCVEAPLQDVRSSNNDPHRPQPETVGNPATSERLPSILQTPIRRCGKRRRRKRLVRHGEQYEIRIPHGYS